MENENEIKARVEKKIKEAVDEIIDEELLSGYWVYDDFVRDLTDTVFKTIESIYNFQQYGKREGFVE